MGTCVRGRAAADKKLGGPPARNEDFGSVRVTLIVGSLTLIDGSVTLRGGWIPLRVGFVTVGVGNGFF